MARRSDGRGNMRWWLAILGGVFACALAILFLSIGNVYSVSLLGAPLAYDRGDATSTPSDPPPPPLNKGLYNEKLLALAHVATSSPWYNAFLAGTTTPIDAQGNVATTSAPKPLWPVHRTYPNAGAILPFNRIVAYYGNFYSTAMGVLGEYPQDQVLSMLASTTRQWEAADPSTPVIPAIDYIAVTAQGSAGSDGMYRARMPDSQIQKAIDMANQIHGLVIFDIQVGLSNVQTEIPLFKQYLELPNVELAIDPEFSMKDGTPPGREIGTYDASDINWVANYMASIVDANDLPPKILIVHRFTEDMVTNYKKITPLPEVQVVMDMDGWGFPAKKVNTYQQVIAPEPVQFTGFKLFYKADLQAPAYRLMTPAEVLSLTPAPIFIQYQ
ncbi:MAG TPA: hypothetical protein VMH91_04115 [Candidatus Paceibacterota bacterium]|nr:hypothetical protein [Candidatus Paceibacterota bacterium]